MAALSSLPDSVFAKIIRAGDDTSAAGTQHLAQAAWSHAEDKWMRNGVLSGIGGREPAFLQALLAAMPADAKVGAGMAEVLAYLGGSMTKPFELEVAGRGAGGHSARAAVWVSGDP